MKGVIFTNNSKKCAELELLLAPLAIPIFRYTDGYSEPIEVIEDGATFEENAIKKLTALNHLKDVILFADDSGLEVDALNGDPGIYSARYGGPHLNDVERCEHLLSQLSETQDRQARFKCVIAVKLPHDSLQTFTGTVEGTISTTVQGDHGFGYDPIFIPAGHHDTFGSLPIKIKHSCSHRAKALNSTFTYLKNNLAF